jgi:type IV pilus assembly protein PilA
MRKSAIKGFTLIELLVVVAIIGILAAIGVVSFSGYTGSAKISAAKSNHAQAIKSISAELKKCEIQGGNLTLMTTAGSSSTASVPCAKSSTSTAAMMTNFIAHLNNSGFKNPYDTTNGAMHASNTTSGYTKITVSSSTITIQTYYEDSANPGTTISTTSTITDERG